MNNDPQYKQLKKHIVAIFGNHGEQWLAQLPDIVARLTAHWNLTNIHPVDNMTFNYVAKATTNNQQAVVLKISCDAETISYERQALQHFAGNGSIQLLDYHETEHALLLQQALPGVTLKSFYETNPDYVMDSYVDTMHKLHSNPLLNSHGFQHIRDWLKEIDALAPEAGCPAYLLKEAIPLKNALLDSMTEEVFLHGDLHHDNILQNGKTWVAIDPKGVIGEPAFEIAAFDFMYISELANTKDLKNVLSSRIALLAEKAKIDPQRINDWVFVRLILMATWLIEDHEDPSWATKLASALL